MSLKRNVSTGFVCLLLAALAGCLGAPEEPTDSSTVWIPLVQPGSDGTVYRLRDAIFHVTGPGGVDLIVVGGDDDAGVSLILAPGQHSVELLDGWSLERSVDGGVFEPLTDAILASENPDTFRVFANRTQTVAFQFILRTTTADVTITFGVVETPRQLAGTIRWLGGHPDYAAYFGTTVDFSIFYAQEAQSLAILEDGSRARFYDTVVDALEIYNDGPGLLAPLAARLKGALLSFRIAASPDQVGVPEPQGTFSLDHFSLGAAPFVNLVFPPGGLAFLFSLDDAGFPVDGNFAVFSATVELRRDDTLLLSGRLTGSMRHFIE